MTDEKFKGDQLNLDDLKNVKAGLPPYESPIITVLGEAVTGKCAQGYVCGKGTGTNCSWGQICSVGQYEIPQT